MWCEIETNMDDKRIAELLNERLDELKGLPPSSERSEYKEWDERTKVTLRSAFSPDSREFIEFGAISFFPPLRRRDLGRDWAGAFNRGRVRVVALLEGILYGLANLGTTNPLASHGDIYPPLWEHVEANINAREWPIVASQSAIFLENQLREWTGADADTVGVDLAMAALHRTKGRFPMGATDGEQDGWHLLTMGFFQALSNSVRHRIDHMDNPRAYALGVLGTASLILSQISEHYGDDLT